MPEPEQAGNKFYKGKIVKILRGNRTGLLVSDSGRELLFEWPYVRLLGAASSFEDLHEEMEVGFDVGHTSKGLRVSVIHVCDIVRLANGPA